MSKDPLAGTILADDAPVEGGSEVRGSSGWLQTLGFSALVLLILQGLSGIGLAFHYVPSADLAYDSIRAIEADIAGGAMLRSLHYYGASFLIACVLLAVLRIFLFGAYKSPQRCAWVSGLLLFMLVIASGVTGELLPWTEQAYFATQVRTGILAATPAIGPELSQLALGGDEVAGPGLLRFYVLHVLLLPAGMLALVIVHLRRLCKKGLSNGAAGSKPWDVGQFLRQSLVALLVSAALFYMAWAETAPLGAIVEPGDTAFEASPEWHFLWLNELLRLFPGELTVLPAFWIPSLLLLGALLLPFVDTSAARGFPGCKYLLGIGGLVLIGIIALSMMSLSHQPENRAAPPYELGISPLERQGYLLMRRHNCMQCHKYGEYGETDYDAPDLDFMTPDMSVSEIAEIIADPEDTLGTEDMPGYHYVPEEDRRALAMYLIKIQQQ
ncbi:MAG: cytochrome b [Planctomycetota bacterium]|jgi:ubiquinol-cytochrome c reductase cytochrome b subunit